MSLEVRVAHLNECFHNAPNGSLGCFGCDIGGGCWAIIPMPTGIDGAPNIPGLVPIPMPIPGWGAMPIPGWGAMPIPGWGAIPITGCGAMPIPDWNKKKWKYYSGIMRNVLCIDSVLN